jgi:hypothetical protein
MRTWLSMLPPSSSLSGAAPSEAPGWSRPEIPRRFARFSSRFARRISTCCSSRRRRSSSGLKALFALKVVRRCSGMYLSAMLAATQVAAGGVSRVRSAAVFVCTEGIYLSWSWGQCRGSEKAEAAKRMALALVAWLEPARVDLSNHSRDTFLLLSIPFAWITSSRQQSTCRLT